MVPLMVVYLCLLLLGKQREWTLSRRCDYLAEKFNRTVAKRRARSQTKGAKGSWKKHVKETRKGQTYESSLGSKITASSTLDICHIPNLPDIPDVTQLQDKDYQTVYFHFETTNIGIYYQSPS